MYILILLMTYVSAIYEFNLSVRPDYDRDVARKKAMAIFYKFDIQHSKVVDSIRFASSRKNADESRIDPAFPQPNTIFAASYEKCEATPRCKNGKFHDTTLFFRQDGVDIPIYLRPECDGCHVCQGADEHCDGASSIDYGPNGEYYQKIMLTLESSLYDGKEMASKLLCLKKRLHEDDNDTCTSPKDASGNFIGTCCGTENGRRILVSYKSIDPRWLNRVTNGINMDFWRAIEKRPWYTNLGVVQWNNATHKWIFKGKTSLYSAYYENLEEWNAKEAEKVLADSSYTAEDMPRYLKRITTWELPDNVFDEDFFVALDGVTDLCKANGCIFRINEM